MEHKIDRLSKLPNPILEHILSFIPLNQTLQLSILSKTWQNVWTLFPIPVINPGVVSSTLYSNKEQEAQRKRDAFTYFVERTLLSRCTEKLSLKEFKVRMTIDESYRALVSRWLGYAIESNVKKLQLCVWPHGCYHVPDSVMAAKSITKLCIWGCKFESFHSDVNLSSLKKLVLGEVYMDDQIFQTLIAGCPAVEEIKFQRCFGLKNIRLSGLLKLVTFEMTFEVRLNSVLESIEIEASNLKSLLLHLPTPCQINLLCKNLKKLALYSATVTDKWLHDFLFKHPLIESLDLYYCNMLKTINISSHRMKSLIFLYCKELVEVNIIAPNLHTLRRMVMLNYLTWLEPRRWKQHLLVFVISFIFVSFVISFASVNSCYFL